ncbi:MAG: AhpC/TSA family protein [Gemmataceae bacterium]|nr:AhpC/TSA family protein [Gemmataceae bacterium]
MQGHYGEIRALGGEVLAVSFTGPVKVRAYVERHPLPFAVVADPDRIAYRAFALERTSWWTFLQPGVIGRYLKWLFRGVKPEAAERGEDVLQLGGDFVIDRAGRLAYAYRSAEPTDRPAPEEVRRAVRAAAGS